MAESELIRAQRYHERARRLNDLARTEKTAPVRAKLLELAGQYEQFCRRILSRHFRDRARKAH